MGCAVFFVVVCGCHNVTAIQHPSRTLCLALGRVGLSYHVSRTSRQPHIVVPRQSNFMIVVSSMETIAMRHALL